MNTHHWLFPPVVYWVLQNDPWHLVQLQAIAKHYWQSVALPVTAFEPVVYVKLKSRITEVVLEIAFL